MTNDQMLALVEQGEADAAVALDDLRALWVREDEQTAANRKAMLEAHDRGARDRDEARVRFGGVSLYSEAEPEPAEPEAPATESDAAPRMSSLPVTPLASLGQGDAQQ